MNDGEAYSANAWQISTALTGHIPDLASVSQMRGIHILDRAWGLERYYSDVLKERVIPPVDEYEVGLISYIYAIIYAAYGFMPVLINLMNVLLHLFTAIIVYTSVIYIQPQGSLFVGFIFSAESSVFLLFKHKSKRTIAYIFSIFIYLPFSFNNKEKELLVCYFHPTVILCYSNPCEIPVFYSNHVSLCSFVFDNTF